MTETTGRPAAKSPLLAASTARRSRVLMKGNEAIAEAAIQAGCDAYFGYPITPQAELLEWMARRMPEMGRVFIQAESELGAINMALGAAATGARVMVSSSSPGISLMAEAMSYMAGSGTPMVLVNVMRAGPGLGGIGPSQSDYFQATKGHGHGDYRVPVLAPASISEAIELVATSFELAERYRTPVMLVADGILGQAMEPVELRFRTPERQVFDWALTGAAGRPSRIIKSIDLQPEVLERRNNDLQAKYAEIRRHEVRWSGQQLEDAEFAIVAYGTAARVARTAIEKARARGLKVGLIRPITLWPFPEREIARLSRRLRAILVVEMSAGQMVEDVRLAVEGRCPVSFYGRTGGVVPSPDEVVEALRSLNAGLVRKGHSGRRSEAATTWTVTADGVTVVPPGGVMPSGPLELPGGSAPRGAPEQSLGEPLAETKPVALARRVGEPLASTSGSTRASGNHNGHRNDGHGNHNGQSGHNGHRQNGGER